MSQLRITRADVAKRAEVSETIVSYVLNNNRYVRQDKRERVLKAVTELNYQPSPVARMLKGKKSNHIAFIADQIANEHFGKIIEEMDRQAYGNGYLISLCSNHNEDAFVAQLLNRQFDGIVISSISFPEERVHRFVEAGVPVVLLMNRDYGELPAQAGRIDTGLYAGARACVRHLAEDCGRRRILYIDRFSAHGKFSTLQDLRFRGFVHQMEAFGLSMDERNVITGCANEEQVIEAIQRRIAEGFAPDAVFGRNDRLAVLGIEALVGKGFCVPGDVSVIGFDNSTLSRYTTPALTTMEINRSGIAKAAFDMLCAMIEGEPAREQAFETRFILRESTLPERPG